MNARHIRTLRRLRPRAHVSRGQPGRRPRRGVRRARRRRRALRQLRAGDSIGGERGRDRRSAARVTGSLVELALAADKHMLDREAGVRDVRRAGGAVAGAEGAQARRDGRREPAFRAVPSAAEGAAARRRARAAVAARPGAPRARRGRRAGGRIRRRCRWARCTKGGVHWIRRLLDLAAVFESGQRRPRRRRLRRRASRRRSPRRLARTR